MNIVEEKIFQEAFSNKVIHVIAPASGISLEKIKALSSISTLELNIPELLLSDEVPYHANSDENRFQFIKAALWDCADHSVVWALRGGYGTARLIEQLRKLPIPRYPKTVIGFSDITALHLFLSQQWHWNTIHASGISQILDREQEAENYLRIAEILSKKVTYQDIQELRPLNHEAKKNNKITGRLTGGNLTLVESSIGTCWEAQTARKIVFLEEVGEKGYRVDRSLYHLYQAGLLKDVKAIVLGQFIEPVGDGFISFALQRFADEINSYGTPVYKTEQFGHGNRNYPLIYNAEAEILYSDSPILRMKLPS